MSPSRSTSVASARTIARRAGRLGWLSWVLVGACASQAPPAPPPTLAGTEPPAPAPTPPPEPPTATPAPAPRPPVIIDRSGKATHYLVELPLRLQDLVVDGELMQREMAYTFVDGGQFEIYVRPAVIPVPSPGCAEAVIVRMPWSPPDAPWAAAAVEAKRALWKRIDALVQRGTGEVTVAIQLDPYVEVATDDPATISLTRCTVFFRHAGEAYAYVDHVGPLGD
jgi:hypothetical protein